MREIIVALSGASGAQYAIRLIQVLVEMNCRVYLTISAPAAVVLKQEVDITIDLQNFSEEGLLGQSTGRIVYHHYENIAAPIASGTMPIDAMVIIPCSMSTLAGVAAGLGNNLLLRAADVTLKERRPLILVPRETPLGAVAIENMLKVSRAGACVLPAMPAFYQRPETVEDMVDFVVGKVLDQLRIPHDIPLRWRGGT